MTADVIQLPVDPYPPRDATRVEKARERLSDIRTNALLWIERRTIDRSPIVLVRRTTMYDRERNAFELGRDCARYMDR